MIIANLAEGQTVMSLVKTLSFNAARLNMIAENVANSETPGYRTQRLDTKGFQKALRAALDRRDRDPGRGFDVRSGREVATSAQGFLEVTPSVEPAENILFHDGTNMSLERQMSALAETAMMQDLAATLLRGEYEVLRKAIRGRVS